MKQPRRPRKAALRTAPASVRKAPGRRSPKRRSNDSRAPAAVTREELRVLRAELESRRRRSSARGAPMRWNPDPEEVQKSVAQLVLTIVEFLRQLMERQAIRRMEQKTLTRREVEAVGAALMTLEQTVREIGERFGLTPEDLNLDLGPLGKLL